VASDDIAGRADPQVSLALLWGKREPPKRGPRSRTSVTEIVDAAIVLADAEGLEAVSTRRVAEAVGISAMSFYTHIPGKAELLDLMLDRIVLDGTLPPVNWKRMGWRARLDLIATGLWGYYLKHPWVAQIQTHRPPLGPNTLAAYEVALSAVDDIGLTEVEMDLTIASLSNYVKGAVRDAAREKQVAALTGMSDDEWWRRVEPFLMTLDYTPYPVSSRVGPIVGELYGTGDPELAFRFGLDRYLDGLALFIEPRLKAHRVKTKTATLTKSKRRPNAAK
jgi:AcrR family transcriptional regulator